MVNPRRVEEGDEAGHSIPARKGEVLAPSSALIISEKVPDVGQCRVGNSVKYQASSGLHLATFSDATVKSGKQGSKLRYKISVVRSHLEDSIAKAKTI